MPEDREPTEQEQQKRYDECADKEKKRTRKLRFRTPQELANFLVSNRPSYAYLSPARIKDMFPNIGTGLKKLKELMQNPDFLKAVNEQIPEVNKQQASGMFDMILQQYFEGQMQLKRGEVLCPDAKAITIFGQFSGKYDPMQKMELYDGHKMTEEKQKELNKEIVNALLNRIKREQGKEKEEESKNDDT
jgi:hypothetical protein